MHIHFWIVFIFIILPFTSSSQCNRWKWEANYTIDVELDHQNHQYKGKVIVELFNTSGDTLSELFFHTYNNAFKPGSDMDIRSRTIADPDGRVRDRIAELKEDEQGHMQISSLMVHGKKANINDFGTIVKASLSKPILPGQKSVIELEFNAKVPIQIRRSGRMNAENIHYSMAQWYPKLCHYDENGWHAYPYIGREFYGIFGNFKVNILIDTSYTIAGTGYLMNANTIGKGYADKTNKNASRNKSKHLWSFEASQVHDFMWAADPNYVHVTDTTSDGIILRAFYVPHEKTNEHWPNLLPVMKEAFAFIQPIFGKYPYSNYAFIQGGDGGMEYPMATLITGHRNLNSLVGVSVHELMHSWYQGVLGFNESKYYWMDEGFTSYASERVMNHLAGKGLIKGESKAIHELYKSSYTGYANLVKSGQEEPLSTHADHFNYNTSYGIGAYSKGALYLHQLSGIIGQDLLDKTLLDFYNICKFHHPTDWDFIRLVEKNSGMQLKWYNDYWIYSTKSIDYEIANVKNTIDNQTTIQLRRKGDMPMPLILKVKTKEGQEKQYNIPLNLTFKEKINNTLIDYAEIRTFWYWPNLTYDLNIPYKMEDLEWIQLDPENKMMDIDRTGHRFDIQN